MLDVSAKQEILKRIRLVIVDRQPIVLQGLKSVLGTQLDFDVVASAIDGTSCLEAIRNLRPDVALVADTLPDLTASEILAIAKAEKFSTRLVFFTDTDIEHDLTAAIATGACTTISKYAAPATMLRSLRLMTKSGVSLEPCDLSPNGNEADGARIAKMLELLTQRERQIAQLVSEGMSNKEIARKLNVSDGTVKVHLYNIFQKLEITNRTVLATIALLQRTSGFGTLALAFLVFAIADELKATEANEKFASDDRSGHVGEHAGYEIWKKAILQHFVISQSSETPAVTERDLFAKASQITNPAAAMEALRAAEQFMGSKAWKEAGPVGSSTSNLPALLLAETKGTPIGADLGPEHHVPRLASNPMSIHGGYGIFAALAGALIYALQDPQLAQAHETGRATIDSLLASISDDAGTKVPATTHVDAKHAENSAPETPSHDFGRPSAFVANANDVRQDGLESLTGPDAAGVGLQKPIGLLDPGHDFSGSADSRDQLTAGNVESVDRSLRDAKSDHSDSVLDFASGPGRINLAAFGALALLHLTAASKSIPPHTLAWVYNAATNQTIVYVNSTDRTLDIGDRGLLEIHLQGIVSIAESDFVHQSEGATVAATLEQLEALISGTATDEAVLNADSAYAGEGSLEASGVWSALADDGWSFQFAQARTGAGTSAKFKTFTGHSADRADTADESADASGAPAYGSSNATDHGAPAAEKLSSKSDPMKADTGAVSSQQNEMVPPGLAKADGTGRGNSDHASEPGWEKAATDSTKQGNGVGHDPEHHSSASDGARGATKTADRGGVEHGNAGHDRHPSSANAVEAGATADSAGGGNSDHSSGHGSAKAAAKETAEDGQTPGSGAGHDKAHHSSASDGARGAAKTADEGGVEHGNAGHDRHPGSANAAEGAATADSAGGGHSDHGSGQGSAKAKETAEAGPTPGNGFGHDNEHHSSASDGARGAAKTADKGGAEHGNAGHSASAKAPEAEPSVASADDGGGGHLQHTGEPGSAKVVITAMTEAGFVPRSGRGNGADHHAPASDAAKEPAGEKTAGPAVVEYGKSWHSASANAPEATGIVEPGVANGRGAGDANGKQAAQSDAPASEAAGSFKAAPHMGGSDQEQAFRFAHEANPSTPVAYVESRERHDPHDVPGQESDLGMLVEMVSHVPDERGAHHGNHGPHHGIVPPPHDLLI